MKKIRLLLIAVATCGTFMSSAQNKDSIRAVREQRYRAVPFMAVLSYGSQSLPISGFAAYRPQKSDLGFFFGGVMGETFTAKTESRAPYHYTKTANDYAFAGLAYFLKNVSFGIGVELQSGTEKGKSEEFQTIAGRTYFKWVFPKSNFFITASIFGRKSQYFGYYTTALNKHVDIGIYGNSNVSGIGPLIKFGGKKISSRLFGFSIGYHPARKNLSATLMAAR